MKRTLFFSVGLLLSFQTAFAMEELFKNMLGSDPSMCAKFMSSSSDDDPEWRKVVKFLNKNDLEKKREAHQALCLFLGDAQVIHNHEHVTYQVDFNLIKKASEEFSAISNSIIKLHKDAKEHSRDSLSGSSLRKIYEAIESEEGIQGCVERFVNKLRRESEKAEQREAGQSEQNEETRYPLFERDDWYDHSEEV